MFAWFAWGLCSLVAALVLFRLFQLFAGPMLRYHLVQLSRRPRFFVIRFAYGVLLLALLLAAYSGRKTLSRSDAENESLRMMSGTIPYSYSEPTLTDFYLSNAQFANSFFSIYTVVQYVMLLVLTPAFMAGVLTEQKERKTFHILFTTDLSSLEMVFGLFVSRFALLGMIFVAGLPVVPLLEFLGGVDPYLIWSCTIALLVTILSVGAVSALNSVLCKDTLDAILGTYMLVAIYLCLSALSKLLLMPSLDLASYPSTATWKSPVTVADVVGWLNLGNFGTAAYDLVGVIRFDPGAGALIRRRLIAYVLFHGLVAGGCGLLTVVLLRRQALAEPVPKNRGGQASGLNKLLLNAWPLLWLECHLGSSGRKRWSSRILAGCGIALLFFVPVHLCYFFGRFWPATAHVRYAELLNLWARPVVAFLGTLLLIQAAIRAGGAVVRDHAKQTSDGLFMMPIGNAGIVASKWFGSLIGSRRIWAALGLLMGYGLFAGAITPVGVVCFVLAWLSGGLFVTALGIWMSVEAPNARVAAVLTLVLAGGVMLGIWLNPDILQGFGWSEMEQRVVPPPMAFFYLLCSPGQLAYWTGAVPTVQFGHLLTQAALWILFSFLLFEIALVRFRQKSARRMSTIAGTLPAHASWSRMQEWCAGLRGPTLGEIRADFRDAFGRGFVFLLPLIALCAIYSLLGLRNATQLAKTVRELNVSSPDWRVAQQDMNPGDLASSGGGEAESFELFRPVTQTILEGKVQALALAREGKIDEALRSAITLLRSADAIAGGQTFPKFTKRQSLQAKIYALVETCLGSGVASEETLNLLIKQINDEVNYPYVSVAMRGARAEFDLRMTYLQLGHTPQDLQTKRPRPVPVSRQEEMQRQSINAAFQLFQPKTFELPKELPRIPETDEFSFLMKQALPLQHSLGLAMADEAIDIWTQPRKQRLNQAADKGERTNFTSFDTAGFESGLTAWELVGAQRNSLLGALLVERYRVKHSRWPASVTAVVQETGQPFPADPCADGVLRYRNATAGVLIYSIGFDGVDNNGKLYTGSAAFPPGGFDIGVKLLDVKLRKFVEPEPD